MQRMSLALVLFVVFCVFGRTASAAEFPRNPDQRPSLGISMGYGAEFGDSTVTLAGASALQDLVVQIVDVTVDARWPVSNNWTLTGALSVIGDDLIAEETASLPRRQDEVAGMAVRFGARYYFGP